MIEFLPKHRLLTRATLLSVCLAGTTAMAQTVRDDVGYTALHDYLGENAPTGAGINIAVIEPLRAGKSNPEIQAWLPAPQNNSDISHLSITDKSSPLISGNPSYSAFDSSHSGQVSKWLFSQQHGLATGITNANFFHLENFTREHLLPRSRFFATQHFAYQQTNQRVFETRLNSISATGDNSFNNSTILRQFDWATATEDAINVISAGNSHLAPQLFASSYNGIYVGVTDPISGRSTNYVDNTYSSNRQRPDLVTPMRNTSRGTAVASSLTAVVLEKALDVQYSQLGLTQAGDVITNAARSEVIKSVLMAGASRKTSNTRNNAHVRDEAGEPIVQDNGLFLLDVANIENYREGKFTTDNGLDERYGAGQADLSESIKIIESTEQDSREDGGTETVSLLGFDYDEAFGNARNHEEKPNSTASYLLPTLANDANFSATLAWNLDIYGRDGLFVNTALYDLDLWLYDVTNETEFLVAYSASDNANTENIWTRLFADRDYEIRVNSTKNITALLWDYGLAWRTEYIPAFASSEQIAPSFERSSSPLTTSAVPLPGAALFFGTALLSLAVKKRNKLCKQHT